MPLMLHNGKILIRDGKLAISTDCCCVDEECCDLGDELLGTFSERTGTATAFPDTITLTKIFPFLRWVSNTFANPCAGLGGRPPTSGLTLECQSSGPLEGQWTLTGANFPTLVLAVDVSDCEDLFVAFDVTYDDGAGCAGSFHLVVQG